MEVKRPDYLLKNVSPRMACILEAKAANEEQLTGTKQAATDDIETYIESNTFAKYLESREKRYLVAIGTDGLHWVLWAKDVRSREMKRALAEVDLTDAIDSIAKRDEVIEGNAKLSTVDIRQFLANEFIPPFAARSIDDFVREEFGETTH